MPDPKVSIIVTTYGRAEHLKQLFDSLRTSAPHDAYELVIVSSDPPKTEKAAWLRRQTDAKIIFADSRQSWQLRKKSSHYYYNVGIKNSHYEWILPVNDDMFFDSHWYEEFCKVISDSASANVGLIIVASHIASVNYGIRVDVIGKTKKGSGDWKDLYLADVSLTRRDIMESVGMLDENLDWFGFGADHPLAVEFLTDTNTIVAENIKINHSISKENRSTNFGDAFSDFYYVINKWNRWCKKHNCQYVWDPGLPPYTAVNRIKNYLSHSKKILRYYAKHFLRALLGNK